MSHKIQVVITALAFLLSARAQAETVGGETLLHVGAKSLSRGEAFRAEPRNHDNILFGSAILALEDQYGLDVSSWLTPDGWHGLGVSAVDSRTGPVSMGLSYRISRDKDFELDPLELPGWEALDVEDVGSLSYSHNIGAAVALSDRARIFSVGISGQRWWRNILGLEREDGWRLGGSLAVKPSDVFAASIGGQAQVTGTGARGAEGLAWLDAGLALTPTEELGLYFDALLPLPTEKPQLGLGAQYDILSTVPVQVGWARESGEGQDYLTAGIGALSPEMYIQYGVRIPVFTEGRAPATTHTLAAGLNF